ncbi:MAG: polysaccharide biosynthesis protein [Gaiellaceae bacterium]
MTFPITRHRLANLAADAVLIAVAWRLTFWLRFDQTIPPFYRHLLDPQVFALVIGIKLVVFALFGFYNRWWRYVSTRDMWGAARGVVVASLLVDLTLYAFPPTGTARLPRGIALIDMLLLLALVAGSRLLARSLIERPATGLVARGREVLIVGAGDAASLILRELQRAPQLGYTPIGLLDDDPRKKNLRVHGVRVLGTTNDLRRVLRETAPDEVLIAIPSASGEARQHVVDIAAGEGIPVKTLPSLHELIAGDLNLAVQIRPVQVEDVLGREPVDVDLREVSGYLAGMTVLVTGAGGSIGSELCRQIARVGAGRIVLLDNSEPALFDIERELVDERGFSAALPVLGDVGNRAKLRQVFDKYRPAVVFHAAAYKHVPLLEANPLEAVRNNVLATKVVAETAVEFETSRFVLVSTDKAAQPKNLLGQSKAIGEWIVQAYGERDDVKTRFVAVRFGNVLASSGSVIPIFRKQIERGGPVTVTHKEMTRYFMTIPEAVSLIVQAGAIGGGGSVFVLDMGEPVSIYELAENMIRLSGKRNVEIRITGVRPGEKLHEVLWNDGEAGEPTSHSKILSAKQAPIDPVWLEAELRALERLVEEGETLELVSKLTAMSRAPQRLAGAAPARTFTS